MKRHPIISSWIKSAGYDPVTKTLEAQFADGDVYRYFGVPAGEYARFLAADSKGTFLNTWIKEHYRFEHIK